MPLISEILCILDRDSTDAGLRIFAHDPGLISFVLIDELISRAPDVRLQLRIHSFGMIMMLLIYRLLLPGQ